METPRRSYVLPLLLFTLVISVVLFGVLYATGVPFTWHFAGVVVYFTMITGGLHAWQENGLRADPKGFVRRFMAGLMLKMMLSVVLLVLILFLIPKSTSIPLALCFAVLYLAFLAFSTLRLMGLSRKAPVP